MPMRWDQTFKGAGYAGLVAAVVAVPALLADHKFDGADAYMLVSAFVGALAGFLKDHKPAEWDGVDRRGNTAAPKP